MGKAPSPRRALRLLFVLSALVAGAAAFFVYEHYTGFADAPLSGIEAGETLRVERGDSFRRVLSRLREAGVHDGHDLEWQALARQLGADARVQVGEYALEPGMSPCALLQHMRDGRVVSYRFTIVEGWNMRELRAALGRATPLAQTIGELDDAALMERIERPGVHPEGRFLPETYVYTRGDSDLDLLRRANRSLERVLEAAWEARAPGLPLADADEALVLASIIEKETGIAEERARIGGVFVRRLQRGMRLQTDPTVIYGLGSAFDGNLTRAHLRSDTPYNTYTRFGLPPSPIALAGKAAIEAALHPAEGDALYFVSRGDGSHVFSRTLAEHNRAVRRYQLRR